MSLTSERELANAREKLRMLEEEFEDTRDDVSEDPLVRELSLRSLRRLINQLKEEITRGQSNRPMRRKPHLLTSEVEAINTRAKLAGLQTLYDELRNETGGNEVVRKMSTRSLKRLINQMKEELMRYENRQGVRITPVARTR